MRDSSGSMDNVCDGIQADAKEDSDSDDDAMTKQYKVILLGDGAVGKTSLCMRFAKDYFAKQYKQTIGLDFWIKRLSIPTQDEENSSKKLNVALQIWDIGGQSIGSKMLSQYIYGADAILLTYDITNMETFNNLEDWLQQARDARKDNAKKECLMVLGNKADLEYMAAVKPKKHDSFCENNGATGHRVSAKTGFGVEQVFFELASQLSGKKLTKTIISTAVKPIRGTVLDSVDDPLAKSMDELILENERKDNCLIL